MHLRSLPLVVTALIAAAAVPAGARAAIAAGAHTRPVVASTGLPAGVMPMRGATTSSGITPHASATPALSTVHLTYRGGRVLTNPVIDSVLWGTGKTYQPEVDGTSSPGMADFFGDVAHSSYLAWMDEYRVPLATGIGGETLEYGDYAGSTTLPITSPAKIDDSAIQSTLLADVQNGVLPAPVVDENGNSDSVYALFFPAGTTITMQGSTSMVQFCAYHGTVQGTVGGQSLKLTYMVLPDPSPAGGGCGPGTDAQVLESYTSHELTETTTDPDVGLATGTGAGVLGWYDDTNGEIADICDTNSSSGFAALDTFQVQKIWSNAANACVADRPSAAPAAPTGLTGRINSDGTATLGWTPPAGSLGEYDVQEAAPGSPAAYLGITVAHLDPRATGWTTPAPVPPGTTLSVVARGTTQVAGPAASVTVAKATPTIAATTSSVTVTGSWVVHVASPGPVPTGTVTLSTATGTPLGSGPLDSSGVAHIRAATAGTWTNAKVDYSGDPATAAGEVVTTLSSHKASSATGGTATRLSGHRVRLVIQVRSSLPVTGTLTVRLGSASLRSVTLTRAANGRAVVVVTLRPGRRTLTATYAGSATVLGSHHSWTVTVPR